MRIAVSLQEVLTESQALTSFNPHNQVMKKGLLLSIPVVQMGTPRFREAMPLAQMQILSPLHLAVLQSASPMLSTCRVHQSPGEMNEGTC